MMPHAIRRVYVARRARITASLATTAVGAALLVLATEPGWTQGLARYMPGLTPAVLCTFVVAMWLVGLFAYVAARALDEHRFAVAMSRLVMPGADVHADLERLSHERPDQAAREMAHRLEVRSAALPVLAAGVLVPVTALYLGYALRVGGWPVIAEFEEAIARHAMRLAACAGVGAVLAIAMTKRAARLPAVAPIAALLALLGAALGLAIDPWLVPIAAIVSVIGFVVRRLRVERELLEADDPAAGSEIFTLRGLVARVRAVLARSFARVRTVRPIWVLVTGLLAIGAYTGFQLVEQSSRAPVPLHSNTPAPTVEPAPTQDVVPPEPEPVQGPTGSRYTVRPVGNGSLEIAIDLLDEYPLTIPSLAGMTYVPRGWRADVRITQSVGLGLAVSDARDVQRHALSIGNDAVLTLRSCGVSMQPLALRVQGAPGHYVLSVQPTLAPGC